MVKILVAIAGIFLAVVFINNMQDEVVQIPADNFLETEKNSQAELVKTNIVLNLSNQNLTSVPVYVFDRLDTEKLDLSNNLLSGALPAEIRQLQNLKFLNLSNNNFTGVPAEVGQLKNLEVLDLSNNQLTGLPYELGNLSSLKVLNLQGNDYSEADLSVIKEKIPATTEILSD